MARMKKTTYTISINGEIQEVIEIHDNGTTEITSKIEDLVKKLMWLSRNRNLKIWKKINNFHYYAIDPNIGKHFDIKLNRVFLWTDDGLNAYYE